MIHTDCPRFIDCNAAICPLDPNWRKAVHLSGEAVCYYAIQSGKTGAADYHADDPTFAAVVAVLPKVCQKHPIIRGKVEAAAKTGSRGAHLRRKRSTEGHSADARIGVAAV